MMKQHHVFSTKIIMQNPDSIHNYFAWPSIAKLQDGTLAAVASGFRLDHICPFGKAVISYSRDNGNTWTSPAPIIDTVLDDRDAGVLAYGENTVLITSFNNSLSCQKMWAEHHIEVLKEEPGSPQKDCLLKRLAYNKAYIARAVCEDKENEVYGSTYRISYDGGITYGPIFRSPVTNPHGPLYTNDGRLLHIGNVFGDAHNPPSFSGLQCYEINEKGESRYLSAVPPIPDKDTIQSLEPHAIQLPSGRILVHIRAERKSDDNGLYCIYQSHSDDGGKTFSVPYPICDDCNVGAPAHLFRHSSGTLISAVSHRCKPFGIYILTSNDNGETWDTGTLITNGHNWDLGYPCTCELNDGSLYTVWYGSTREGQPAVIYGTHWKL